MERSQFYIENHSTLSDAVLDAVERWAHLHTAQPQMLCGRYVGRMLTMVCEMLDARIVIEVGAFIGYSAICLARGLSEGGTLHSFEVNDEYKDAFLRHVGSAGVGDRVSLHIGDALETLPKFLGDGVTVDVAFIDAGKRNLMDYYEMLVPRMRKGGIIVVDNVMWGGKVLDLEKNKDRDTQIINDFNDFVTADPRVENLMMDVRDGLMFCRVL